MFAWLGQDGFFNGLLSSDALKITRCPNYKTSAKSKRYTAVEMLAVSSDKTSTWKTRSDLQSECSVFWGCYKKQSTINLLLLGQALEASYLAKKQLLC